MATVISNSSKLFALKIPHTSIRITEARSFQQDSQLTKGVPTFHWTVAIMQHLFKIGESECDVLRYLNINAFVDLSSEEHVLIISPAHQCQVVLAFVQFTNHSTRIQLRLQLQVITQKTTMSIEI